MLIEGDPGEAVHKRISDTLGGWKNTLGDRVTESAVIC